MKYLFLIFVAVIGLIEFILRLALVSLTGGIILLGTGLGVLYPAVFEFAQEVIE